MAKPTSLHGRLQNLLNDVRASYPANPLGQDWADKFAKDLVKAEREFGITRLEIAVQRAIEDSTFPPVIADIRRRMPTSGMRAIYNECCPDCHGSGWKRINEQDVFSPVARCGCRKIVEEAS